MRLNAQYAPMVRTSLNAHARLMRMQVARQKRKAIEGAANQDPRTLHVAEQSMLKVAYRDIEREQAARPEAALGEVPRAALTPQADQGIEEIVSENKQILMMRLLRRG